MTTPLLFLLASLIGFAPLSIDMYLPALPAIAADLRAPEAAVQATVAAYLAGMAGGQLVYGALSDRWGRKPPLLAGLVLFVVGSVGCATAGSITSLTAWRVLQALGGCAGVVMSLTLVADRVSGDREMARVMSRLMAVLGLAPIVAPVLGNALLPWAGWRGIFWLLAALAVISIAIVATMLEETWTQAQRDAVARSMRPSRLRMWRELLSDRKFAGAVLAGPTASAGMFAYIGISAFVLIGQHGLTPSQYSAVFAANALLMTATTQANLLLVRRWSPAQVARTALGFMIAASVALLVAEATGQASLGVMLASLAAYLGGLGLVNTNSTALALAGHPPERRGIVSGLSGTLQFAIGAAIGALLGWAHRTDGAIMALAMCTCAALAWVALWWHASARSASVQGGSTLPR